MRTRVALLPLLLLGVAAACGSPTGARPAELAGEWWTPVRDVPPAGTGAQQQRRILRLDRSGRFRWTTHRMGEDGLPLDRDSSWESAVGAWRVNGDGRLAFRTRRIERWRHTDGLDAPPRVETLDDGGEFGTDFTVRGDALTLRWVSSALDAPVETVETYGRARPID